MPLPRLIQSPTTIQAAGNKPKIIEEFVGRVNSGESAASIAHMISPAGWIEPGQTPEFDEYTLVLHGMLRVTYSGGSLDVKGGQAVITRKGEWVQYSSPGGFDVSATLIASTPRSPSRRHSPSVPPRPATSTPAHRAP
jgi:mannose-6-phosphate isomerase-like protein (cupin superfamily)